MSDYQSLSTNEDWLAQFSTGPATTEVIPSSGSAMPMETAYESAQTTAKNPAKATVEETSLVEVAVPGKFTEQMDEFTEKHVGEKGEAGPKPDAGSAVVDANSEGVQDKHSQGEDTGSEPLGIEKGEDLRYSHSFSAWTDWN